MQQITVNTPNDLNKDSFYVGVGIMHLFGLESAFICSIINSEGIDGFLDDELLKDFKKTKIRTALERLLCCGILSIINGKLYFNQDRYLYMNNLGNKVNDERYKNFIGLGTYEEVLRYDEMVKFVKKLVK